MTSKFRVSFILYNLYSSVRHLLLNNLNLIIEEWERMRFELGTVLNLIFTTNLNLINIM